MTNLEQVGAQELEKQPSRYKDELIQDYGDWLGEYHWDLFATLTFAEIPPELQAKGITKVSYEYAIEKWKMLVKKIKKIDGAPPYWVRSTENSMWRQAPHFHALIGGVSSVGPEEVERIWYQQGGLARVYKYDPAGNASYYVSKTHSALEFSKTPFISR